MYGFILFREIISCLKVFFVVFDFFDLLVNLFKDDWWWDDMVFVKNIVVMIFKLIKLFIFIICKYKINNNY